MALLAPTRAGPAQQLRALGSAASWPAAKQALKDAAAAAEPAEKQVLKDAAAAANDGTDPCALDRIPPFFTSQFDENKAFRALRRHFGQLGISVDASLSRRHYSFQYERATAWIKVETTILGVAKELGKFLLQAHTISGSTDTALKMAADTRDFALAVRAAALKTLNHDELQPDYRTPLQRSIDRLNSCSILRLPPSPPPVPPSSAAAGHHHSAMGPQTTNKKNKKTNAS